jgi:hypothetical protein
LSSGRRFFDSRNIRVPAVIKADAGRADGGISGQKTETAEEAWYPRQSLIYLKRQKRRRDGECPENVHPSCGEVLSASVSNRSSLRNRKRARDMRRIVLKNWKSLKSLKIMRITRSWRNCLILRGRKNF